MDLNKYHFFLGGYDAEMLEIRNILEKKGCKIHDRKLKWGARASDYSDEIEKLKEDEMPVFIELSVDIKVPERAIIVDHHGPLNQNKTSLEQVADLLGIELNRFQRLLCANDRGHIRAMIKEGATDEEIKMIRSMDREAQGICEDDYVKADKAIKNLMEVGPRVAYIESETETTSPIIDKIYQKFDYIIIKIKAGGEKTLISGPGKYISRLVDYFNRKKKQSGDEKIKYWYGGMLPDFGYFGANLFDDKVVELAVEERSKDIKSLHVFLFPFRIGRWDIKVSARQFFSEDQLKEVLQTCSEENWVYRPFSIDSPQNYNNYSYFHDHTRQVLFGNLEESVEEKHIEKLFDKGKPKFTSLSLERKNKSGTYKIYIKGKAEPYVLYINDIKLRLFETGIGILSIELFNLDYPELDDVIKINDFGRRIYPQFLGTDSSDPADIIGPVKDAFLADKIEINLTGGERKQEIIAENFNLDDFYQPKHPHLHIGKHIINLLGEKFTEKYRIEPVIDDRMYVNCWFNGGEIVKGLTQKKDGEFAFESDPEWYKFIFIDGKDCLCPDEKMRKELIAKTTYRRYSEWGTLYGISRYSLVCMGSWEKLKDHMLYLYRLMSELLLAQRASIISFFSRVAEISHKIDIEKESFENIASEVRELQGDFIGFEKNLWSIEITPQEQGIEMYKMAQENMDLKAQMDDLRTEIGEIYNYVEMTQDRILNEGVYWLTVAGILLAIIGVMLAFWSVPLASSVLKKCPKAAWPVFFVTTASLTIGGTLIAKSLLRKHIIKKIKKHNIKS